MWEELFEEATVEAEDGVAFLVFCLLGCYRKLSESCCVER